MSVSQIRRFLPLSHAWICVGACQNDIIPLSFAVIKKYLHHGYSDEPNKNLFVAADEFYGRLKFLTKLLFNDIF